MSLVQLPLSAAALSQDGHTSPLGRYLAGYLASPSTHNGLHYDHVSLVMTGALALAAAMPFDPDEVVEYKQGLNPIARVSLLEAVLRLSNSNFSSHQFIHWPLSIEDFGAHLEVKNAYGKTVGVDTEWTAAALTAAGCNPWKGYKEGGELPRAVQQAVLLGFGGLVHRFLQCPGAPSAQVLAESPLNDTTVWVRVAENSPSIVQALVLQGAKLSEKHAVEVLAMAHKDAVELLAQAGLPTLSVKARAKIQAAWKARTSASTSRLSPEDVARFQETVWGEVDVSMSQAALTIANLLGVEWTKRNTGSQGVAYDFMPHTGVDALNERAAMKSGPMAGQWSTLAAAVASRIRQGSVGAGVPTWSPAVMLHRYYDDSKKGWQIAECSQAPFKGCLKPALGFEWKPGIAIDGIVALGLWGQGGAGFFHQANEKQTYIDKAVEELSQAADIGNMCQWGIDHAPDAARFTLQVLKSPKINAAEAMEKCWHNLATQRPDMLNAVPDELRAPLLMSLSANFTRSASWTEDAEVSRPIRELAQAFYPGFSPRALAQDPHLCGAELSVALVVFLATQNRHHSPSEFVNILSQRKKDFSSEDISFVEAYIKADVRENNALNSWVQQCKLEQSTLAAGPTRRSPRL